MQQLAAHKHLVEYGLLGMQIVHLKMLYQCKQCIELQYIEAQAACDVYAPTSVGARYMWYVMPASVKQAPTSATLRSSRHGSSCRSTMSRRESASLLTSMAEPVAAAAASQHPMYLPHANQCDEMGHGMHHRALYQWGLPAHGSNL